MTIDTMPAAQAVETLIADYGKLVFHVILGMTSDWDESQDLTQDTFVQALRAIDAARQASGAHFHAKAWLLQVAVNMVRMSRRRRGSVRVVPFSSLRQEEQEEMGIENVGERAVPVQPAGFGMGVVQDPADLIAESDAVQRIMYNPARFSQEEQRNRARSIHNTRYLLILWIINNLYHSATAGDAAALPVAVSRWRAVLARDRAGARSE
jgi:DNA-directed RNA polymerase specialized sigma24 family protein